MRTLRRRKELIENVFESKNQERSEATIRLAEGKPYYSANGGYTELYNRQDYKWERNNSNLNKFINECLYFDNIYYQTAGGNTSDAEFCAILPCILWLKELYITDFMKHIYSLPKH